MLSFQGDKMKIYINEPPRAGKNNGERIDAITDWLLELTAKLNLGFQHIGEENLNSALKERLNIND